MTALRDTVRRVLGPLQSTGPTPRNLAYVLALVLPLLSSAVSGHFVFFRPYPFALHFLSMALIATLGGLWPALLALLVTMVSRIYFLPFLPPPAESTSVVTDFMRLAFLLFLGLIISYMGDRSRRYQRRLETSVNALHESTETLMQSLNSSRCAAWTLDLDSGQSARWHGGSYPVFGRPFSELEVMPSLRPLLHPEDQPRLLELVEQMRSSWEPIAFEHRVPWPDGELHWLEMRATRIPGKACAWRGVTVDITDRKLAEAAVLRAEKLAAMGRLASTVAHEINNPLEAVTNLLYLANTDDTLGDQTRTYLSTAETEVARLGNITRLTLGFVRNSGVVANVDVSTIVDDVLSIFRHRLDTKSITVERHYEPDVCVKIAPHELRQIVTNLIANAADAVSPKAARIAVHICREDPVAVLLVDDNGTGITEANLHRIFDPFFSTKQEVGTGIGLWVSRELAEKYGGSISAQTRDLPPGAATRFRVELPLAQ